MEEDVAQFVEERGPELIVLDVEQRQLDEGVVVDPASRPVDPESRGGWDEGG